MGTSKQLEKGQLYPEGAETDFKSHLKEYAQSCAQEARDGWISVKDRKPELGEDVLCLGYKATRPEETVTHQVLAWVKLEKPIGRDSKGNLVEYGWCDQWWNTNPDLFDIYYWHPLPQPPRP